MGAVRGGRARQHATLLAWPDPCPESAARVLLQPPSESPAFCTARRQDIFATQPLTDLTSARNVAVPGNIEEEESARCLVGKTSSRKKSCRRAKTEVGRGLVCSSSCGCASGKRASLSLSLSPKPRGRLGCFRCLDWFLPECAMCTRIWRRGEGGKGPQMSLQESALRRV